MKLLFRLELIIFQFFVRTPDDTVERYLKLFTFIPLPVILPRGLVYPENGACSGFEKHDTFGAVFSVMSSRAHDSCKTLLSMNACRIRCSMY